jgi:hypothetical protein
MAYDKPLRMTKNPPVECMQESRFGTECPSTAKEAFVVKTSIPEQKRQNYKDAVGKSKPSLKYGKDYHFRMDSAVLLADPSFIDDFLLSIFSFDDLEEFKYFSDHLLDDFTLINKPQSGYSKLFGKYIFQLSRYLKSLTQENVNPNDLDNFPPDPLYLFDVNDLREHSAIIDPLIDKGFLPSEDSAIFMEKFFLGVNPSKKARDLIRWMGPKETLIAWLIGSYFTHALFVGDNKGKKHRMKDPDSGKYERKGRAAVRPCFKTLIDNHFYLVKDKCNPSTIHRGVETIFDYFLELRVLAIGKERDISQKKVLMDLLTSMGKEQRESLGLSMKENRYENIISGCSCIPE